MLRFGDPVKYPELYNPDLFYDEVHMNPDGARLFTDQIARAFIDQIASSPKPRNPAPVTP